MCTGGDMHDQSQESLACSELFALFETRWCASNSRGFLVVFFKYIVKGRKRSYISQFTIKVLLFSSNTRGII